MTKNLSVWAFGKIGASPSRVLALCADHDAVHAELMADSKQAADLARENEEVTRMLPDAIASLPRHLRRALRKCGGCSNPAVWKDIIRRGHL